MSALDERLAAAVERLGHDALRPAQLEAARAVVAGRDVLCVMPTGSGKSLIYQVAGLVLDGPTVVVSPLVALQRDQVESLDEGLAAEVNAQLSAGERADRLDAAEAGEVEFVLVAPEQLANEETRGRLAAAGVSLVVVDEAHCVSEWGHDFRPDYLRVGTFVEALGRPRLLALTATASDVVRDEIVERLTLRDPVVLVHGFDRPEIHLAVETHGDEAAKLDALVARVAATAGAGIVYRATRAGTESLAARLVEAGVRALPYHAGLARRTREQAQAAFMAGDVDVIVATVAFGMGVDKPDVRFVFHGEPSDSPDAYWQEVGRAGRDGEPAEAVLFYRPQDIGRRRFHAAATALEREHAARVAEALAGGGRALGTAELEAATGLSRARVVAAVGRLADLGAVAIDVAGRAAAPADTAVARVAAEAAALQERHRAHRRTRLEMLRGYAETTGCRRSYLLALFGERLDPPCGACDRCDQGRTGPPPRDVPFAVGARVVHEALGAGQVQRYEGDAMTVLFDDAGYRVLGLDLVEGLLVAER